MTDRSPGRTRRGRSARGSLGALVLLGAVSVGAGTAGADSIPLGVETEPAATRVVLVAAPVFPPGIAHVPVAGGTTDRRHAEGLAPPAPSPTRERPVVSDRVSGAAVVDAAGASPEALALLGVALGLLGLARFPQLLSRARADAR